MIVLSSDSSDIDLGVSGSIKNISMSYQQEDRARNLIQKFNKSRNDYEFISKMVESSKVLRDHFKSSIIYINVLNVVPTSCTTVKVKKT